MFWKDRNSVFLGCNQNFAKSAGLDHPEELIGKTDYDMPWSKEESDFFRKIDEEVMSSGIAQLNFEEPQTLSDGSKRWISTSKVPLFNEHKNVVGILGWYIDITPFKSMQFQINEKNAALIEYSQRLEKTNNELEIANRDMEMFTYALSHDLKSPIANILNFSDLILKTQNDKFDQDLIQQLNFVRSSGIKMDKLVQNILIYARTGLEDLTPNQVQIKSLISDKIVDLDQLLVGGNSDLNIDIPDISISCFPDLLGIVFHNLIGNGLKYNNSARPKVEGSMEETPTEIIFSIKDNGIGVDSEFQELIFQPFKRLHSTKIEGTGLGLSICRRIVELHKGKIWLQESTKSGSSFKFSISKSL